MAKPKGYWTKEKCIEEIKRLSADGFDLSAGNTRTHEGSLYTKSLQLIGSWKIALELAGLDYAIYQKKKGNGYWTHERIIEEIKMLHRQETDLSAASITKINNGLYQCAIKSFGSWNNALVFCGIDYQEIKRKRENNYWTSEAVKEEVFRLIEDGIPLNARSVEVGLYKGAIRIFGSWENALTSFGMDYSVIRLNDESQKVFGQQFERVVHEIMSELSYTYEKNREVEKGLKPDIVFPDGRIFDVKLSNYTDYEGRSTVEKYGRFATKIGIIFLRGEFDEVEYEVNNVVFRHVSYYTRKLPIMRRDYYDEILNEILVNADTSKEVVR